MDCYYYKVIHETENPIIKNIDVAIVLMMENSHRFKEDPFLLNLAKKTIVQYNKGFRSCKKPGFIDTTSKDLVHAYCAAFQYTVDYNNVLILEDDAEILYYTKSHYELVDKYISGKFKIFSFANYGKFTKIDENFYKSSIICGSHSQIISKSHRRYLMEKIKQNNFMGHIDRDYFGDDVVVYKYPLIVQLFTHTENRKNWDTNKTLSDFVIKLFELDTNKSGWEIVYLFSKLQGVASFNIFLLHAIFFAVFVIYRK